MTALGRYFDANGHPITLEEWAELFEERADTAGDDESWWRKRTQITDDLEVSTVWLGLDHRFFGTGPPLIWETMIFGGAHDEDQWRYSTRGEAFDDHERIVRALRAGVDPDDREPATGAR